MNPLENKTYSILQFFRKLFFVKTYTFTYKRVKSQSAFKFSHDERVNFQNFKRMEEAQQLQRNHHAQVKQLQKYTRPKLEYYANL